MRLSYKKADDYQLQKHIIFDLSLQRPKKAFRLSEQTKDIFLVGILCKLNSVWISWYYVHASSINRHFLQVVRVWRPFHFLFRVVENSLGGMQYDQSRDCYEMLWRPTAPQVPMFKRHYMLCNKNENCINNQLTLLIWLNIYCQGLAKKITTYIIDEISRSNSFGLL